MLHIVNFITFVENFKDQKKILRDRIRSIHLQ